MPKPNRIIYPPKYWEERIWGFPFFKLPDPPRPRIADEEWDYDEEQDMFDPYGYMMDQNEKW